MIAVAICPTCAAFRYKSRREYSRGEPLNPDDFEPVPPQGPAVAGKRATCIDCGADLQFRLVDSLNKTAPTPEGSRLVDTLFEARAGEEVHSMKELGDRLLIVTSRRVLVVNLETFLIGANGHVGSA